MSDAIQVDFDSVHMHYNAINGHSSVFDISIPKVEGGSVAAIAEASSIGTQAGGIALRYVSALQTGAGDIRKISDTFKMVDYDTSRLFETSVGGHTR